jgi:hypothetical protein
MFIRMYFPHMNYAFVFKFHSFMNIKTSELLEVFKLLSVKGTRSDNTKG